MPVRSTLLSKPLGHPLLDFFLINELTTISSIQANLYGFLDVDVVLNVFKRRFIRKLVEKSPNRFLWLAHG